MIGIGGKASDIVFKKCKIQENIVSIQLKTRKKHLVKGEKNRIKTCKT